METEELSNISISPLVTDPFAAQWSADDQISVITEKGVHIFKLEPSPMSPNPTVKFARSFIHSADTSPCAFVEEINQLIWNMKRENIYSLLMENAITPKLNGINNTVPRIEKIAWSPKNLISPSQCMLAILNTSGAVNLLHKFSNEWYSICDISSLWLNIMEKEIKSNFTKHKMSVNQHMMIMDTVKQLLACSMTWSELFKVEKTSFAYFCVAYCSGHISIWKVPRISNYTAALQPIFINKINLNIAVKINTLCWITIDINEYLLLVGFFDGRLYGVKLNCKDNNLQIISIEKYIEPDYVTVNCLHIISQDKSNLKIFAIKGSILVLLCINCTGILKSMQYLQVGQFNITGITAITAQQFFITTQDNYIFVVDIQTNDLISIDIKSHLPQTRVQYLGLTHSPNKVIFINITSPNMLYDHLITREPSIMHMFTLKDANPLSIINNNVALTNVWDCIEMLRVKATRVEDPSTVLCPITENLESLSFYNLQVSMWMTVMSNVCKIKKPIPNMDHIRQGEISQALPLIFVHSACTYLDNLKKKDTLSKDQLLAASLLRKYLKMHFLDNDKKDENDFIRQRIQETLNVFVSYPNQIEKCNLCDEVIDELVWNVMLCPSGHKLPRCAMTLLQITSLEYYVCPICSQVFHLCLEEVYEEPRCQFCDVPILYNSYAIDVEESELYGQNLSRLQVNVTELREQEEEPSRKKQKTKWNISDKCSPIVNNDDESDRITETWEEF